jgi:hypothetical protein
MGGATSHVRIGATRHPVLPDLAVSRPTFFQGFNAYLSTGMCGLILPTGDFRVILPPEPASDGEFPSLGSVAGNAGASMSFTPVLPDWRALAVGEPRESRFCLVFSWRPTPAPAPCGLSAPVPERGSGRTPVCWLLEEAGGFTHPGFWAAHARVGLAMGTPADGRASQIYGGPLVTF